jgi:hypothetical protein
VPEGVAGDSSGPQDEITIDPFPVPHIPVPRVVAVIAGRIRRARLPGNGWRPTRRGWLLTAFAAIAAIAVTGALQLAGVIWTSTPPAWAAALGPGVTVTAPRPVAPGHGSPGAALTGYLAALSANDPATACGYLDSGAGAECGEPSGQGARNRLPYGVSFTTGYVAIDGTRALVGFTGKICSPGATPLRGAPPECMANSNPAAIFSARNTFAALWTRETSQDSTDAATYVLLPCVEAGGKWYVGSG